MSTEPFLKVWEHHVFQMLIEKGRIKPKLARRMQNWKYTGFSVHREVKIEAGAKEGLRRLTNYIARCALNDSEEVLLGRPVAEAKIHRDSPGDKVLYDAEHPEPLPFQKWKALPTERTITRNFEVFDPLDFLAHRSCHLRVARGMTSIRSASGNPAYTGQESTPDQVLRLVFECDFPMDGVILGSPRRCETSDAGKRAKGEAKRHRETYVRPASKAHKRWAMLLKQVYEVDPLQCDRLEGSKCPG